MFNLLLLLLLIGNKIFTKHKCFFAFLGFHIDEGDLLMRVGTIGNIEDGEIRGIGAQKIENELHGIQILDGRIRVRSLGIVEFGVDLAHLDPVPRGFTTPDEGFQDAVLDSLDVDREVMKEAGAHKFVQ